MFHFTYSTVFLSTFLITYVIVSKLIFDRIYNTASLIIDEEFHFQLGEAYCKYEFDKVACLKVILAKLIVMFQWHPKITTFPGLYLLSSLLLGAFDLCSTYWLRLTSLFFSFVNLILFYLLLSLNNEKVSFTEVF